MPLNADLPPFPLMNPTIHPHGPIQTEEVALVSWKHPRCCHQPAAKKAHHRTKDPFAVEYHSLCLELEAAVLALLKRKFSVETGLCLLTRRKSPDGSDALEFHELDFVLMGPTAPELIGELKLTSNPTKALARARGQLHERLGRATLRWPGVRGLALCYHIHYGHLPRGAPVATSRYDSLHRILRPARRRTNAIFSHVATSDKLFEELSKTGLADPAFFERLAEARRHMDDPPGARRTGHSPDPAFNSLENAFASCPGTKAVPA